MRMAAGARHVSARVVQAAELVDDDIAKWTALFDRAVDAYPFADPALVLPSVRLRPDARGMRLLVVEAGDEWLLVTPFTVERRDIARHVNWRVTSNWDPFLAEVSSWKHPLVDSRRFDDAFDGLIRAVRDLRLPGLLALFGVPGDGPVAESLARAARRHRVPVIVRWSGDHAIAAALPDRSDATPESSPHLADTDLPSLGSVNRKKNRRLTAKILREVGEPMTIVDRGDDPAAIVEFLEMEAAGWKGDSGRGGGAFAVSGEAEWFTCATDGLREAGRLHVFQLAAGGRVLHMAVVFRAGSRAFGVADCYDEQYSSYSPGRLGRIAVLHALARDARVESFDPHMASHYTEAIKLFPDSRPQTDLLLAPGRTPSRVLLRALVASRRIRARIRSGTARSGPDREVRVGRT